MITLEVVALSLLLAGNLLVLRWLIVSDPIADSEPSEARGSSPTETEPAHLRHAA